MLGNLSSLPPREVLAARKPHGSYTRYKLGCRCEACRKGNSRYVAEREKARRAGDFNGIVPADRARDHLLALAEQGIGRRQVSIATDIPASTIAAIRTGAKPNIRARTERKVLAVTADCAADRALISAKETWGLIQAMLDAGHTKRSLAALLGYAGNPPSLQLNKHLVTVKNAAKVHKLHRELGGSAALRLVSSDSSNRKLSELIGEGFRADQLILRLGEENWLRVRRSMKIPACLRDAVARLYEEMTS